MLHGQVVGSAVGSHVFLSHGWRASAGTLLGFVGFTLLVLFARGPHAARYTWLGWEGGARLTKARSPAVVYQQDEEKTAGAKNPEGEVEGHVAPGEASREK